MGYLSICFLVKKFALPSLIFVALECLLNCLETVLAGEAELMLVGEFYFC